MCSAVPVRSCWASRRILLKMCIRDRFGGMENFTLLNAIAERFEAMWESTQIKYKAVLQAERIYSLEKALDVATHIQEYELSYYSMDSADFMRMYMAHHLPEGFDMEMCIRDRYRCVHFVGYFAHHLFHCSSLFLQNF